MTEQVLTRAGGRVEVVASLSQDRTAAAQCGLFTHRSVPVIFEPPCTRNFKTMIQKTVLSKQTETLQSQYQKYETICWFSMNSRIDVSKTSFLAKGRWCRFVATMIKHQQNDFRWLCLLPYYERKLTFWNVWNGTKFYLFLKPNGVSKMLVVRINTG